MWMTVAAIVPYDLAVLCVNQRLVLNYEVPNRLAHSDKTNTDHMPQPLQGNIELLSNFSGQHSLQSDSSCTANDRITDEPVRHASKRSPIAESLASVPAFRRRRRAIIA